MDDNQMGRVKRALEVLAEKPPEGPRSTADVISDLAVKVGKLDYWLRDILDVVAELDGQGVTLDTTSITRKYGG